VIEFRDPSWYDDRVFERLDQHKVALCLHDMQGSATRRMGVGPFVYVRFHFGDRKYGGAYDGERLDAWSRWLSAQAAAGRDVFAYFNNDTGGHAPKDAIRLRVLLPPCRTGSLDSARRSTNSGNASSRCQPTPTRSRRR
jgi:uncharacterized protein YecE (DUF72 family)